MTRGLAQEPVTFTLEGLSEAVELEDGDTLTIETNEAFTFLIQDYDPATATFAAASDDAAIVQVSTPQTISLGWVFQAVSRRAEGDVTVSVTGSATGRRATTKRITVRVEAPQKQERDLESVVAATVVRGNAVLGPPPPLLAAERTLAAKAESAMTRGLPTGRVNPPTDVTVTGEAAPTMAPDKPTLTVGVTTATSIEVAVAKGSGTGGEPETVMVEAYTTSDFTGSATATAQRTGVGSVTLTGLDPSTTYYIRANATNSSGTSGYSTTATQATTAAFHTVPMGAPTSVNTLSVEWNWTNSADRPELPAVLLSDGMASWLADFQVRDNTPNESVWRVGVARPRAGTASSSPDLVAAWENRAVACVVRIGAYHLSLPGPAVSGWWNDLDDDTVPYSVRADSNELDQEFEDFCQNVASDTTAAEREAATVTFFYGPAGDVVTTDTDRAYQAASSVPELPTGGTTDENHVPAGWMRTEPPPTSTQDVYGIERTRTYTNAVFTSATAWADVAKVADRTAPGPIGVATSTFGVGVSAEVLPPIVGPTPTLYRIQIRRQDVAWDDAQNAAERTRTTAGKVQFNVSASYSWVVRARAETAQGNGPWVQQPRFDRPGDGSGLYTVNVPINRVGATYGVTGGFPAGSLARMPDDLVEGTSPGFLSALSCYTPGVDDVATFDLNVSADASGTAAARSLVQSWESRGQATIIAFPAGKVISLPGPANSQWTRTDSADPYFATVESPPSSGLLNDIVAWRNRLGPTQTATDLGGATMRISLLWG